MAFTSEAVRHSKWEPTGRVLGPVRVAPMVDVEDDHGAALLVDAVADAVLATLCRQSPSKGARRGSPMAWASTSSAEWRFDRPQLDGCMTREVLVRWPAERRSERPQLDGWRTMPYLPRIADAELTDKLASSGAVLIEGPRACGKTATALQVAASTVRFDTDRSARAAAGGV